MATPHRVELASSRHDVNFLDVVAEGDDVADPLRLPIHNKEASMSEHHSWRVGQMS
jgi:hypothetical protein